MADANVDQEYLTTLPIEALMDMDVEITSVSRQKQKVAQAPAAVSVIGQEDIRRSGMTSIPELLRMSPGLNVARINANQWAVSSRGFNDLYSNKLLVLMDGRTLYTPLFSGVYWDTQDYILQDLERIEVIRGPGATLWGANAVNGVINISTKSARDTQGTLLSGYGSNLEQIGGVRYGGTIDDKTFYRIYTKYRHNDDFLTAAGDEAHDAWQALRGGFRIDRYASDTDTFTLQGDLYGQKIQQTYDFPTLTPPFVSSTDETLDATGGNILGRWTHKVSDKSDFTVQLYYDRIERDSIQLGYALDTVDLDVTHRFPIGDRQEVIWGFGLRYMSDSIDNSAFVSFRPRRRNESVVSAFVQDDIEIFKDKLHLILGSKFELNGYTGFEIQPGARALWTPNEKNTVWAAVSRAVRTPARWEEDARLLFSTMPTDAGMPGSVELFSDDDIRSENVIAYELGYRVQARPNLSLDFAVFFNDYDDLRSGTQGQPFMEADPSPHLVIPLYLGNDIEGETYGAEVAATWNVAQNWRLVGSYSWLMAELHRKGGVDPTLEHTFEGTSPQHQFQVRSYYDITRNLELNVAVYYVDPLDVGNIPSYTRVDAGVTWRPKQHLEISAGVQNLLDDRHREFNSGLFDEQSTETPVTVFGQVVYRF